jgi:hypothetical protein
VGSGGGGGGGGWRGEGCISDESAKIVNINTVICVRKFFVIDAVAAHSRSSTQQEQHAVGVAAARSRSGSSTQ